MKKYLKQRISPGSGKNKVVHFFTSIVFVYTFLFVLLFSSRIIAQKLPASTTGAPLKGVDVKLGKNPGGSPAARTTTNDEGHFDLGVVPAGSYILALSNSDASKSVSITINGSVGGPINMGWNFEMNKPFNLSSVTKSKSELVEEIKLTSDGHTPFSGSTIIRSKSNITNN